MTADAIKPLDDFKLDDGTTVDVFKTEHIQMVRRELIRDVQGSDGAVMIVPDAPDAASPAHIQILIEIGKSMSSTMPRDAGVFVGHAKTMEFWRAHFDEPVMTKRCVLCGNEIDQAKASRPGPTMGNPDGITVKMHVCEPCGQAVEETERQHREARRVWAYLSFCDATRQSGQQWIGSTIIKATGIIDAAQEARRLGVNPGGSMMAHPVPMDFGEPPDTLRNVLVTDHKLLNEIFIAWTGEGVSSLAELEDGTIEIKDVDEAGRLVDPHGETDAGDHQIPGRPLQ